MTLLKLGVVFVPKLCSSIKVEMIRIININNNRSFEMFLCMPFLMRKGFTM